MSVIESVYNYADESDYIDQEHIPSLSIAILVTLAFYLELEFVTASIAGLDGTGLEALVVSSFKGILAGIITTFLYSTDENSFQFGEDMQNKEKAVQIVIVVTLAVGFVANLVAPAIVERLSHVVMQLIGAVFILAFFFVHLLVPNWRLDKEWPHLLAGAALFLAPLL